MKLIPLTAGELLAREDLRELSVFAVAMGLSRMDPSPRAACLAKLNKIQREACLDFDLWDKDQLDVERFGLWLATYHQVESSKLKREFLTSEQFALFLKGVVNISTFDDEDPQYPEHENFFLTDDHLLLFEYHQAFPYADELKDSINTLYSELGLEEAYTHLFKIITDSFTLLQEDQYVQKKSRLQDFGFVDYFDALEKLSPFASLDITISFIQKKPSNPSHSLDSVNLDLLPPLNIIDAINSELAEITDPIRREFLQFNFVRLVNASLSQLDAFHKSELTMTQAFEQTQLVLLLGLSYIKNSRSFDSEGAFSIFDFFDVYKVGKSLVHTTQMQIKKALALHRFDFDDPFLGQYFLKFLAGSFHFPHVYILNVDAKKQSIVCHKTFAGWSEGVNLIVKLLPFIAQFRQDFSTLKSQGLLRDSYYLNYSVGEIDFEAIILSSLINFHLGYYRGKNHHPKMGLLIHELVSFSRQYFCDQIQTDREIANFLKAFGLECVPHVDWYLRGLLEEHLKGYDFSTMTQEEFAYVGGPILMSTSTC